MFFYLYLILDLYSRKIVGWEVHAEETATHASALVQRAVLAAGCLGQPLVLHADNHRPSHETKMGLPMALQAAPIKAVE